MLPTWIRKKIPNKKTKRLLYKQTSWVLITDTTDHTDRYVAHMDKKKRKERYQTNKKNKQSNSVKTGIYCTNIVGTDYGHN